jgi:ribonuclease HI
LAVTVYKKGLNVVIDGIGDTRSPATNNLDINDITRYIIQSQSGRDMELLHALIDGEIMIMSDGSAKDDKGAAAWIITSERLYTNNIAITGSIKIPTCKADSYRAECFGILGGLWSVSQLIQRCQIPTEQLVDIQLQVGCDNKSALQNCFDHQTHPHISGRDSDFDVLLAVRSLISSLPKIDWRHVKGHQQGPELDIWAKLNNHVDVLAGTTRDDSIAATPPFNVLLPGEKWQLLLGDQKIYKNVQGQIYDYLSRSKIFPFWVKKERFSPEGIAQVNWKAIGAAMRQSSPRQRQWITKRASRECGANQVLHRRNAKGSEQCKMCNDIETVIHVLRCPDIRAQQQWDASMQEFREWLNKHHTDPALINQLCTGLTQWRLYGSVIPQSPEDNLIMHQNLIGWNGVLEGCFSVEWGKAQQKYFESKNSLRTGLKWQTSVCRRIWMIPWDMWKHRNDIEHLHDVQNETAAIDNDIQDELNKGSDCHPDLEDMIMAGRLMETENRSLAYKKGWLRSIHSLRSRITRRGMTDRIMVNMRAHMRRFLHTRT